MIWDGCLPGRYSKVWFVRGIVLATWLVCANVRMLFFSRMGFFLCEKRRSALS